MLRKNKVKKMEIHREIRWKLRALLIEADQKADDTGDLADHGYADGVGTCLAEVEKIIRKHQ